MYTIHARIGSNETEIFKYETAAEAIAAGRYMECRIFDDEGNELSIWRGRLFPASYCYFRQSQELK